MNSGDFELNFLRSTAFYRGYLYLRLALCNSVYNFHNWRMFIHSAVTYRPLSPTDFHTFTWNQFFSFTVKLFQFTIDGDSFQLKIVS